MFFTVDRFSHFLQLSLSSQKTTTLPQKINRRWCRIKGLEIFLACRILSLFIELFFRRWNSLLPLVLLFEFVLDFSSVGKRHFFCSSAFGLRGFERKLGVKVKSDQDQS